MIQALIVANNHKSFLIECFREFLTSKELVTQSICCNIDTFVNLIDELNNFKYIIITLEPNNKNDIFNHLKVIRKSNNHSILVIIPHCNLHPDEIKSLIAINKTMLISAEANAIEFVKGFEEIKNEKFFLCKILREYLLESVINAHGSKKLQLTVAEQNVLDCYLQGFNIKQSAEMLNMSIHTVTSHRRKMMKKHDVNSMNKLAVLLKS